MAEERTLGLARAHEQSPEDLSKEDLQRRLDEARGSISNTVTEIKESVANQVQAVKETLDWREQFKKRPIAWTAGAAGAGFLLGYGLAALVKGDNGYRELDFQLPQRSYASHPVLSAPGAETSLRAQSSQPYENRDDEEDTGPGLLERLTQTPAYEKVKHEASGVAETLLQELAGTAKAVVVPALIKSVKDFLGNYLPSSGAATDNNQQNSATGRTPSQPRPGYQPVTDRS